MIDFREIWRFRELLYFLAWRDVKLRYKQTALGVVWAILQPLLMMIVFTVFFSRMAGLPSAGIPYILFACTGLLPWTFFSTAIANSGNSVVGSEKLITKIYFPRLAIPFASVGAAIVDFAVSTSLLALLMVYYRVVPGPGILLAPFIFGLIVVAAMGVGTMLAALNVAYRDFRYVIPFLVQLWMFATPTLFMQATDEPPIATTATVSAPASSATVPSASTSIAKTAEADATVKRTDAADSTVKSILRAIRYLNPMTGLISAFRASVLGGPIPWTKLASSTVVVFTVFVAACFYFRKVEDTFADII
jgi:lipopolysaccharide transport system permease protein